MKPRRVPSAASTSVFAPGSRSFSEEIDGAEAAVETTQPTTDKPAIPMPTSTTMTARKAWER